MCVMLCDMCDPCDPCDVCAMSVRCLCDLWVIQADTGGVKLVRMFMADYRNILSRYLMEKMQLKVSSLAHAKYHIIRTLRCPAVKPGPQIGIFLRSTLCPS